MLSIPATPKLFAQPAPAVMSPALSPAIEWKDVFWPPRDMAGDQLLQEDSNEDWYYDLIEYKQGGVVAGYVAVGYSRDPGFYNFTMMSGSTTLDCYSKTADYIDCKHFTTPENPFTLSRQMVVFYDLEGNMTDYFRYNFGQFWGIAQDANEDLYLFGCGVNPRNLTQAEEFDTSDEPQLGSGQIYYNPTATGQPVFPLNCLTTDPFERKFNVVKIGLDGQVDWNNYYGLENNLTSAHALRGMAYTGVIEGNTLLAGGTSTQNNQKRKFLVALNKNTGNVIWKDEFEPSSSGEIYQISKKNDQYLISGIDYPVGSSRQGFCSLVSDNGSLLSASFAAPDFYHTAADIPPSVDTSGLIDTSEPGRTTSAIFTNTNLYWFVVANKTWGGTNGIGEGIVVQMDLQGNMLSMDAFGEIRAYDLWLSGTPTDDGGFALITTRHSPMYYDTGTRPGLSTPLDLNQPSGSTMNDCLVEIFPNSDCPAIFYLPDSRFWNLMSTCAYVRKYDANFNLQWDKIWDSTDNAPRECFPGNLKQQECLYRIVQSSVDGGLVMCGNTSDNIDDCYIVKLENDCGLSAFNGMATGPDLIVDYSDGIYDITSSTTWTTPKKILGSVRIKPGKTLTIQNTTVEIAGATTIEGTIDIEQNAYLKIDNSTLTTTGGCSNFWRGISVWGDTDEHQYYDNGIGAYHQGRVLVENQSTIEYAHTGIRNWHPDHWDELGGIIRVEDSEFLNCNRAIEFMSYQNFNPTGTPFNRPDQSHIYKTEFKVDNDLPLDLDVQAPKPQVTLWKTDRVRIEGCTFLNESTVPVSEYRGMAIHSSDANYIVKGYCPPPVPAGGCGSPTENTFTGWHKAINATESTTGRAIQVSNTNFDKNMIGIALVGAVDGSEIYKNHFFLGDHPFAYEVSPQVSELSNLGIYTSDTHLFTIEENDFKPSIAATEDAHGVLIKNSKGYDNEIYKNTFEDLKVAANGLQVNRNANGFKNYPAGALGLQFLCNDNTGNEIDFKMSRVFGLNNGYYDSGMRANQGDDNPSKGANDTFSAASSDPNIYTHWTINTDQAIFFRYNYHSNPPLSSEITPGKMDLILTTTDNGCQSNYTSGGVTGPSGMLLGAITELGGLEYTYAQLIDEGNTQNMLNDIALTWPEDAWELRDELMARSPYNSEEVLIAAAKKEIMPHAMLLEVLLANPDVIAQGHIIKVVQYDLMNPMPAYMVDMLYLARDEKTLRTSMENSISYWHAKASRYQKAALAARAFDLSEVDAPDSTLWILSRLKTPQSDLARANILSGRDDYRASVALIDSVRENYKLMPSQEQNLKELGSLYGFFDDIKAEGKHLPDLPEEDIATLRSFAENGSGTAAQKAQNALCFHYGICYDNAGNPKSNPTPKSNNPYPDEKEVLSHFNNATAYPSPAQSYTTIAYNLLYAKEKTQLNIYDAVGRRILSRKLGKAYEGQELIDTRKQANGLYIYEITQDGNRVANGKFIVNQ